MRHILERKKQKTKVAQFKQAKLSSSELQTGTAIFIYRLRGLDLGLSTGCLKFPK